MSTFSHDAVRILGSHKETIDGALYCEYRELLDLSNNELTDLPEGVFSGFIKLHTLDLSSNKFSTINVDTFSVLPNLLSLDLSRNFVMTSMKGTFTGLVKLKILDLSSVRGHLNFTSDSPFQYLQSLQTLLLDESSIAVTPATFVGLNHTLQVLTIWISHLTTDTPFVHLSSLQHLDLGLWNRCNYVNESLFVGLDKLKYLKLTIGFTGPISPPGCIIDFSPLVLLTNFTYGMVDKALDIHTKIQTLNSLNSSLQTLDLEVKSDTVKLNSTTLESLSKWKKSLQELTLRIYASERVSIQIEGSPFQWFPQLQRLHIQGTTSNAGSTTFWNYPENAFKGLANLKEVHLNYLGIGAVIAAHVLKTSALYSLERVGPVK